MATGILGKSGQVSFQLVLSCSLLALMACSPKDNSSPRPPQHASTFDDFKQLPIDSSIEGSAAWQKNSTRPAEATATQSAQNSPGGATTKTAGEAPANSPTAPAQPLTSDQIKKGEYLKIQLQDLSGLSALERQADQVLFHGKLVDLKTAEETLAMGNEDHFCQVKGTELFQANEYVKIEDIEKNQIDKVHDVYESKISFDNDHGKLIFTCQHTTPNFYLESFAANFVGLAAVLHPDNTAVFDPQFQNPKTLKRTLNTVKIADFEALMKAKNTEKGPEFAFLKGNLLDANQALTLVQMGPENMACYIEDHSANLDKNKIYISVKKGILQETAKDIPTGMIFNVYRADKDNFFIFVCSVKKTVEWQELIPTLGKTLEFGSLNRLDYNKLYDENFEIQKNLDLLEEKKAEEKRKQESQASPRKGL